MVKEQKSIIPVSNVMSENDVRVRIERTLKRIFEIVASTSGPFGSNVIIQDDMIGHYTTKDGYTVMKNIVFKEEFDRTICEFIKKVSARLNNTVGDGTTSAVIIATKLYEKLLKFAEFSKLPYRKILDYLNIISNMFEDEIPNFVKKIDVEGDEKWKDKLYKIAYTSSNNNSEIAKLVINAFEKSPYGVIDIKNGSGEQTTLDTNPGYEHRRGYINQFFALKDKKFQVSGKVKIFMSSQEITDLDLTFIGELLQHVCLEKKDALIIIAPSFSEGVVNMIYQNKMNPQIKDDLKVCLVDIPTKSNDAMERFFDLATFSDSNPYLGQYPSLKKFDEAFALQGLTNFPYLGTVDSATISEKNSYFGIKELNKASIERCKMISQRMKEIMSEEEIGTVYDKSEEIAHLRKRYTNLSPNGAITIKIGAATDQERKNLYYLIEDAIQACRSAIKFGIVPGLNYANFNTLGNILKSFKYNNEEDYDNENKKKYIPQLIKLLIEVYEEATRFILFNGNPEMDIGKADTIINSIKENQLVYDIKKDSLYALKDGIDGEFSVYNSVETDIEVFKTSLSIIGLLLNSNNFVCSKGYIVI